MNRAEILKIKSLTGKILKIQVKALTRNWVKHNKHYLKIKTAILKYSSPINRKMRWKRRKGRNRRSSGGERGENEKEKRLEGRGVEEEVWRRGGVEERKRLSRERGQKWSQKRKLRRSKRRNRKLQFLRILG